ncbi:MAG: hypothetical protein ACP5FH_01030 [Terracidiphilus sp.]
MKLRCLSPAFACAICMGSFALPALAQNSVLLFAPVNVRLSQQGAGYGTNQVIFNSSTVSLTCTASPISAVLSSSAASSSPAGLANLLVDNYIAVTNLATSKGPVNVCSAGVTEPGGGSPQDCFTASYQNAANQGSLTGIDPDTLVASGGVAPISIASLLVSGTQQIKIDLVDEGGYLASSTLYLNTNCTPNGVTGPSLVTGNTISASNPTPAELSQNFDFDSNSNQKVGFEYDLTAANDADTLEINSSGVNPQAGDSPLDPSAFQTVWGSETSFATSNCLVHTGELLPDGEPACKLFTLECTTGTGATASGAQCPVSTLSNEAIRDVFDGPAFSLKDILTPDGRVFHEGIGLLMASEGWTGGPCAFDPAANLNLPCPQNLLTSFSGPGIFVSGGQTTHPNSTFLSIAGIPEDRTRVFVRGEKPGHWINSLTARVKFFSQPPDLRGTNLPGAANFIPSPIASLTYGVSPADRVPTPGSVISTDVQLLSPEDCPIPTVADPGQPVAPDFAPEEQTIRFPADGRYRLHYYAQDCAGTEELKFQQANGTWTTSFYTYSINVDTVPPAISTLVLSPAPSVTGAYEVGQPVTASYACTDATSGVLFCGFHSFAPGSTHNTGTLTARVDTWSPGSKTFTVQAVDAAGNHSSASITYRVER